MRILVTGAAGFVGQHLRHELVQNGHEPLGLDVPSQLEAQRGWIDFPTDLRDAAAVDAVVRQLLPDACIHLGAVSFIPSGQTRPDTMLSVNISGTFALLEALKRRAPRCKTLVVSTAQIYAPALDPSIPLDEEAPLAPPHLYAISKMAADLAALGYARRHGLPIMTARPNNHTGPGQSGRFVIPALLAQIKAIASRPSAPVVRVGNMESRRIFMDVRDVARAYRLLIEQGAAGEAYNVSHGDNVRLADVLDELCRMAHVQPRREVDPHLYRPTDQSPCLSADKLLAHTGWTPRIPLAQTLCDMMHEEPPS